MPKKLFPAILSFTAALLLSALSSLPALANVTAATVTLGTSTVNTNSQYTVAFNVGAAGASLTALMDNIRITFPTNTTVPTTYTNLVITVNGTTANASAVGQVLTIVTPVDVANSGAVSVVISTTAGIINPSIPAATKTLQVSTTRETTNVTSSNYTVSASATPITVVSVTPASTIICNPSQYTVRITTANPAGFLWNGNSQIVVTFPVGTNVLNGALTGVTVNGAAASSATGNNGARTATIVVGADVNPGTFDIVIPSSNLTNPTSTGSRTLSVSTSAQPSGTSGNYTLTVSGTGLSVGASTVTPLVICNTGAYSFSFTTAADGYLVGGTSTLVITFPAGTSVPASPSTTGLNVNGLQVASASGSGTTLTLTLNASGDIAGGTANVPVVIPVGAGIRNATTTGVKSLSVYTSTQTTAGTSGNYTLTVSGNALVVGTVSVSPATIGNYGSYTFAFNTAADGALVGGVSTLAITFPAGTVVPAAPSTTGLTVGGLQVSAASGSGTTLTLTLNAGGSIAASTSNITVFIPTGANIRNPLTTGAAYTLSVLTSTQTTAGTSGTYAITTSGTALSVGAVTTSPSTIDNIGQYDINFTTSADGALVSGTSTLSVTFPAGTVVPTTFASGDLQIGTSMPGTNVTTASGSGQTVTFTVPINCLASTAYIIRFTTNADIRHPHTTGGKTLTVSSSVQTSAGTSSSYTISTSGTGLSVGAVSLSPNTPDNDGQYDITFTTSADGALVNGTSTISVTFPAGTNVPTTFAAGDLRIGTTMPGTAVTTASGSGQTVTFTLPIDCTVSTAYIIRFTTGANIRNPHATGSKTLTVSTSTQTTAGTSSPYSVAVSSTPLVVGAVTVSPTTIGNYAAYSFSFNTSADGALLGGVSTLAITFPTGTVVPASPSMVGLTVNGLQVSAASGSGTTLTLTLNASGDIAASTSNVPVVIPVGANIRNTMTGGTYSLSVASSSQGAGNSGNFTITTSATPVGAATITLSTSTVACTSQYQVVFTTDATDGALVGGTSTITITLPSDTNVHNGALTGVTVNGSAATASGVSATRVVTITVPAALGTVAAGATITVVIPTTSTNLQNPSTAGAKTLQVHTSTQPVDSTSNTYTITNTATPVNITTVTPSPSTIGNDAQYTVVFTTDATNGGLGGGFSTITLTFPVGTVVTNGAIGSVTVNGTGATSATGNTASRTIVVVPAQDFGNSATITVVIPAAGLRNPTTATTYTLQVHTTSQATDDTSGNYTIDTYATAVTGISCTPNPQTIGNNAQYTIDFTGDATRGDLVATVSQITITFPVGTTITAGAISGVTVNGTGATSATGNAGARTIVVVPAQDIAGGTAISVVIPSGADAVRNPAMAGTYQVQVNTSPQPTNGNSGNYTINTSGTAVTGITVSPSPATIGNPAQYTVNFTGSATSGDLLAGYSTITLTFPAGTVVPTGSLLGITVNGTGAASAVGAGQVITVVPTQFINGGTAISVIIPSAVGMRNPTTANNYQVQVHTAPQPTNGSSSNYAIGTSVVNIGTPTVTVSPTTVGNAAGYTIVFTTDSTNGYLVGGTSQIIITFPSDTVVHSSPLSTVTVNGSAATATTAGQIVTVTVPTDLAGGSTVTVAIPNVSNNLINPTSPASYTLQVHTSPQPNDITSSAYGIGQSVTPVSVGTVTLSDNTVGVSSNYTITMTTSADGPLYSGASHIRITFPDDTFVPTSGSLSNITVNGSPSSATGNGATRVVDITTGANIGASSVATIIIGGTQILNLAYASTGNTVSVNTSAQPAGTGGAYNIVTSATPVSVNSVASTSPNVNGTTPTFTIGITTTIPLRANKGQILVNFPLSAEVPTGALGGVTMSGGITVGSATGDAATASVRIIPSVAMPAGTYTLNIPITTNPSTVNNTLTVGTSSQASGSRGFTLTSAATTITQANVYLGNSSGGAISDYTITFNVGANGRLAAGNIIHIAFPIATGVPASVSAGNITVNGVPNTGTVWASGAGNKSLDIVVPYPATVAPYGLATVVFNTPANLVNPAVSAGYALDASTDAENTPVSSNFYYITADSNISTPTASVSPATIFARGQHTVDFTLGVGGSLTQGVTNITLVYPTAFTLPTTIPYTSITVNGTTLAATAVRVRSGNTLEIRSPVTIGSADLNKDVHVVIQTTSGIVNPSLPGNYSIRAYTSIEPRPMTSPVFAITASTTTQITQPQVSLFPAFTKSAGRYQITFSLGAYGGLMAGVSTINVQFPANALMPASIPAGYITVNGQPTLVASTITGQTITLTVPNTLPVSSAIEIIIESRSLVRNPTEQGDYNLILSTSSEPNLVASNTFHIATATWNDVIVYPNPIVKQDSANKAFTFILIPSETATLKVFTLDGGLVKAISKNDATDRIVWDLTNTQGSSVASGIYIYTLSGPGGSKKGKLGVKN